MNIDPMDDAADINWKVSLLCLLGAAVIFLLMLPNWNRGDETHRARDAAGYTDVTRHGFVFLAFAGKTCLVWALRQLA